MFLHKLIPAGLMIVYAIARSLKLAKKIVVGLGQNIVAGQPNYFSMKGEVEVGVFITVDIVVRAVHFLHKLFQRGDVDIGHAIADKESCQFLKSTHNFERLGNFLEGDRCDHTPTVGPYLDKPFRSQYLQRFPQGGARNTEQLSKMVLVNAFAGWQFAANNHIPQLAGDIAV